MPGKGVLGSACAAGFPEVWGHTEEQGAERLLWQYVLLKRKRCLIQAGK